MLFALLVMAVLVASGEGKVSCGHHFAEDCQACPSGHGAWWCNGNCKWCEHGGNDGKGDCQPKGNTCAVTGYWSTWTGYTACTRTCGPGIKLRMRVCINPSTTNGKAKCQGARKETVQCNVKECVVNGHWGPWSPYSTCSKTCGSGEVKRTRFCDSPPPQNGGQQCFGESYETQVRHLKKCTVDAHWGAWTAYSSCSNTCGTGEIKRTRVCNNPAPGTGGKQCPGKSVQIEACRLKECNTDGTRTNPGTSCKALKEKDGSKKSGLYWIKLEYPTQVFCDMETDGGGWTMVGKAVADKESDNVDIDYKKINSNEISRLGDVTTNRFLLNPTGMNKLQKYMPFDQIRFFCNKPWHGRTIDISTKRTNIGKQVVDRMLGKSANKPPACNSFDRLPDDNSIIGSGCSRWYGKTWFGVNMYELPMFIYGHSHIWLNPARLECDDDKAEDKKAGRRFSNIGRWEFYVR